MKVLTVSKKKKEIMWGEGPIDRSLGFTDVGIVE